MLTPAEIRDMNMAAQDQAITGVHPALHLDRAVEAATLATVAPLVQQLADALENERLRAPHRKIGLWGPARHAARAFLSGATKESTDHG